MLRRKRKDGLSERLAVKWKQRPPSVCTTSFFSAVSIMIMINRSSLDDLPRSFSIFIHFQKILNLLVEVAPEPPSV